MASVEDMAGNEPENTELKLSIIHDLCLIAKAAPFGLFFLSVVGNVLGEP